MNVSTVRTSLTTLYKRSKTGIVFWEAFIFPEPDKTFTIRKYSGKLGTKKPLIHSENIKEGKQKRTILEQAQFQSESDFRRKKDEGYKTLQDLELMAKQKGIL